MKPLQNAMKHSEGQLKAYQGINLYYQCWLTDHDPEAIVAVVHGLAEHSGRYNNLVNFCLSKGYGIYIYDQRGHGKSDGRRCYVEKFSYLIKDLDFFIDYIHIMHPGSKIFLLGHSMGGTVATSYAILHQDKINGLILSGALLRLPSGIPAGIIPFAHTLSSIFPGMGLYVLQAEAISQDEKVVNAYVTDPLVYRGKICARTGIELTRHLKMLEQRLPELDLPLLAMHGTADRLADPSGSQMLFKQARSKDKTLKLYEGLYHEIFNEPDREKIFSDLDDWLKKHLESIKPN